MCVHEQCACLVGSEGDSVEQGGQESHVKGGIVDARHVAAAGWLVLFGLQGERVHVNSVVRNVSVVLVWLNQVKVAGIALGKAIVTVQLQLSGNHGVSSRVGTIARSSSGNGSGREVRPLVLGLSNFQSRNPNQLLNGVIVVQANLLVRSSQGLLSGELNLLDQVLVRHLSETTTLISVKVDVVNPQATVSQADLRNWLSNSFSVLAVQQLGQRAQLQVNLHFVVLQSNQRQGQTDVTAEEELKRDVQTLRSSNRAVGSGWLRRQNSVRSVQVNSVSDHLGVTGNQTRLQC